MSSPLSAPGARGLALRAAVLAALALGATACSQQSDISFVVIVKSSNYAQDIEGQIELLNYHFFSEIFLQPDGELTAATLSRAESPDEPMAYVARGDNYYVEGGHFDSPGEVDRAYPNGSWVVNLTTPTVGAAGFALQLEGPLGATDIPEPIHVSLWQDAMQVAQSSVDPAKDLVFRWSAYSNGARDPRGIVDDMIFLVVANCQGERIFHTGLPFQGEYTTFETEEMLVEAGSLRPGQSYSAFVEFPHVVDSDIEKGVPSFASYATATYLDVMTTGPNTDEACPDVSPPMDTGQTDRMEFVDSTSGGR